MLKKYHCMRRPRTTQERRENGKRSQFARPKRSSCNLPNAWDDKNIVSQRSWKKRRRSQYRVGGRGQKHSVLTCYYLPEFWQLERWMENHDVPCSMKYLRDKNVGLFTWWSDKNIDIQRLLVKFNLELV